MSRFYILIILSATPLKWVGISPYSYRIPTKKPTATGVG